MLKVQEVDNGTDVTVINEILEKDGCVVIKGVLDEVRLQKLKNELAPHLDQTPDCSGELYGYTLRSLCLCHFMAKRFT